MFWRCLHRWLKAGGGFPLAVAITLAICVPAPWAAAGDANAAEISTVSMSGSTGLVRIPTAAVLPYSHYTLGVNLVDRKYRTVWGKDTVEHFATIGLLPRLEVTLAITNLEGRLGAQYRDRLGPTGTLGGWNMDRMFSVQALLAPQTERFPVSIAAGYQDLAGTGRFRSRYLVASHRGGRFGLHLGLGDVGLGRVFGGVDMAISPRVRAMLDHDGSHPNLGAALQWGRFTVTPILTGLDRLGGGVTYTHRLF